MENKIPDREVDLFEISLGIWNNKYKVLLITIIFTMLGLTFHYLINDKRNMIYKIYNEVQPISVVEEQKYNAFNSYIYNYFVENKKEIDLDITTELANNYNFLEFKKSIESSNEFRPVVYDKKLFFELFLKKMSSQKNLEKYLNEFKLIKKDDYKNSKLLLKSFSDIVSSIKNGYSNEEPVPIAIDVKTYNYNQTLEFFIFLNEKINIEVKNEINDIFNSHIETVKLLKSFRLDDIDEKLKIFKNSNYSELLQQEEKFIKSDRYLDRIEIIYKNLPISNVDDFHAGRIIYQSSSVKDINRLSKTLIIFGLSGLFFGIIMVLILNAVKMRKIK